MFDIIVDHEETNHLLRKVLRRLDELENNNMATLADLKTLLDSFGADLDADVTRLETAVDKAVDALAGVDSTAVDALITEAQSFKDTMQNRVVTTITKLETSVGITP